MNLVIHLFIIIPISNSVHCITCEEVLKLPDEEHLNYFELQTMTPKDIVQCVLHLGRKRLELSEAEYIWKAITEYHVAIDNITDDVLMSLNWITTGIKPEDYANITLSDIDVITNFGHDYNLNAAQLSAIADRVREDFGSKEPEHYTVFDLIALGQILCAFNKSEIIRIHPSAYRDAASLIGKLKHCSSEVLQGFADLATQKGGFGPVEYWTNATVATLGYVSEYFPKDLITKVKNRKQP